MILLYILRLLQDNLPKHRFIKFNHSIPVLFCMICEIFILLSHISNFLVLSDSLSE